VIFEFVFVREAIDALEGWMTGADHGGYERMPMTLGIVARHSAEDTFGVFPQNL
jgi:hypothetical protein